MQGRVHVWALCEEPCGNEPALAMLEAALHYMPRVCAADERPMEAPPVERELVAVRVDDRAPAGHLQDGGVAHLDARLVVVARLHHAHSHAVGEARATVVR